MAVKICVAVDDHYGFAKQLQIPWYIPEDFNHFLQTTSGSICITGRHSYLEMVEMKKRRLGAKYDPTAPLLNNRETFVVSNTIKPNQIFDANIVSNVTDTIERFLGDSRDIFILGGRQAYIESMPYVEELIITKIPGDYMCDTFFPIDLFEQGDNVTLNCTKSIETKTHGRIPVHYFTKTPNVARP